MWSVRLGALAAVALTIPAAGCSDDEGGLTSTSSLPTTVPMPSTTVAGAQGSSTLPATTVGPEADGVPGVDDADPFCAAWARYSGTLQAVGVASAFGDLPAGGTARLEVVAAAALTEAVSGIGGAWPADLVAERSVVLGDVVGPFGRRAEKARAALVEAGATDEDLAELALVWLDALRRRDPEQPVIEVAVPARLAPLVDAAAAAFDAAVTPFADDPSLMNVTADTPATDAFLATNCPDLASSGVGDAL